MKFSAFLIPLFFPTSNGESEVRNNYERFEGKLHVPGFKPEEIKVDVKARRYSVVSFWSSQSRGGGTPFSVKISADILPRFKYLER
jgi:hypothetical protein